MGVKSFLFYYGIVRGFLNKLLCGEDFISYIQNFHAILFCES